jgi:diacylglycerol kinase family enzyme
MSEPGVTRWLQGQPAVLVANPTAHSGKAADWIRIARALLDREGVAHRFVATEPEGRTIDRVREVIDNDGTRVVVYMGGDGTFAEVACYRPARRTIRASRSGSIPAPVRSSATSR